jgi:WD40 repeat protein
LDLCFLPVFTVHGGSFLGPAANLRRYRLLTPDGKTLASASFDKKGKLWQTTTGRELLNLPAPKDRGRWLAFSPDGTMLATASHDGSLTIYRADSHDEAQLCKAQK